MADDNSFRSYRSNDPYRRAPEPAREPAGSDPLAELARLIGQNEPMADFGRSNTRDPQPSGYAPRQSAPAWPPQTSKDYAAKDHAAEPRGGARDAYAPAEDDDASPLAVLAARAQARRAESQPQQTPAYAAEPQFETFADDRMPVAEQHGRADERDQRHDEPYYQDEAPLDPHEDEMYDDAPRARRRGGLAMALALVGCAVLGTAGAYAYRSYSVPTTAKEAVPVVTADSMPTKVPAAPSADSQSSKQISDRFATAVTGDNLVSRQEEPVALREPTTPAPPRVVLPAPVQPANPAPPAAVVNTPPAQAQPAPAAQDGPKRVRTVTIRPDGADPSSRPVSGGSDNSQPGAAPPARAAQPRNNAPAHNGSAPLSLSPQDQGADSAPRPRVAAREPVGTVSSGGYLVQLSSQKTESEAQSSFRALQAKFPNELGDRRAVVRRADLGAKGVVYRTNVGPFASAAEAQQFCANYKAAGGQCLVPNN